MTPKIAFFIDRRIYSLFIGLSQACFGALFWGLYVTPRREAQLDTFAGDGRLPNLPPPRLCALNARAFDVLCLMIEPVVETCLAELRVIVGNQRSFEQLYAVVAPVRVG